MKLVRISGLGLAIAVVTMVVTVGVVFLTDTIQYGSPYDTDGSYYSRSKR